MARDCRRPCLTTRPATRNSGMSLSNARNFNHINVERSLAYYGVAHRLVVSYVVDLPFGKGQQLLSGLTGVPGKIVSGWSITGSSTFSSGNPLPLSTAVNLTNSFGGGSRPNSTGVSAALSGSAQSRLGGWFNTAAFTAPPAFTFGNVARSLPDVRSAVIHNLHLLPAI